MKDDAIKSIDGIINSIEITFNSNIVRIIPELFAFNNNFECKSHVLAFAFQHLMHLVLPIQMRVSIAFNELAKLARIVIVAKIQQLSGDKQTHTEQESTDLSTFRNSFVFCHVNRPRYLVRRIHFTSIEMSNDAIILFAIEAVACAKYKQPTGRQYWALLNKQWGKCIVTISITAISWWTNGRMVDVLLVCWGSGVRIDGQSEFIDRIWMNQVGLPNELKDETSVLSGEFLQFSHWQLNHPSEVFVVASENQTIIILQCRKLILLSLTTQIYWRASMVFVCCRGREANRYIFETSLCQYTSPHSCRVHFVPASVDGSGNNQCDNVWDTHFQ